MTVTPAVKGKIRELLAQARVARAMQRAAYEHYTELQEEAVAASREVNRLRSAEERRRWARPNRVGAAAPGAQQYDDVVSKAQRRLERLQRQAREAKQQQGEAEKATASLVMPLERIAAHLRAEQVLGGSQDPLRNLEDLVL